MVNNDNGIMDYYRDLRVAVYKGEPFYQILPPFNSHFPYPEYIFKDEISSVLNPAYDAVRNCFRLLKLDKENFSSSKWNPLRVFIKSGDKVVIKPNFVLSSHYKGGNLFSIITHPSVLRVIVDYVYMALNGEGDITIADAPQKECNFEELLKNTNLPSIQELYWKKRKFEIKILDLRNYWLDKKPNDIASFVERRRKLPGDPLGSAVINLGEKSEFYNFKNCNRIYGADYNRNETIRHHRGEIQEYMISKAVLGADVLISVPKLKVHRKVGVTLNTKGLVGINTNKNYLVHYTLGTPEEGGDQFPPKFLKGKAKIKIKTQRFLYDLLLAKKSPILDKVYETVYKKARWISKPFFKDVNKREIEIYDGGNWYGNDSTWRMISDLMKIALYVDKDQKLRDTPQRKVFSIVDGIIGGENEGPLSPDEKKTGVIIAGFNPLAVDIVGSRLMGFNWRKIKWIVKLLNNEYFEFYVDNVKNIEIMTNISEFQAMFNTNDKYLRFKPYPGWRNYVELV